MKRLLLSVFFIISIMLVASAQKGRVYVVQNFIGISYSLPVNLQVSISDKYEVKASGPAEDIDNIVVEKNGNSITIKSKSNRHRFDSDTRLYVSLPVLSKISMSGSGNISVNGVVKSESLTVDLAGSGDIQFQAMDINKASISVAGSGNVKLKDSSKATYGIYRVAGSGDISFTALQAKKVDVNIAGSGNVKAFASEDLNVKIAGSGNLTCTGSPKNVEKMKFGSGSVTIK